jgi:hypothetical protein
MFNVEDVFVYRYRTLQERLGFYILSCKERKKESAWDRLIS